MQERGSESKRDKQKDVRLSRTLVDEVGCVTDTERIKADSKVKREREVSVAGSFVHSQSGSLGGGSNYERGSLLCFFFSYFLSLLDFVEREKAISESDRPCTERRGKIQRW